MLRIEFQVNMTGLSSILFDIEQTVRSVEIDNALPVADDAVFLFLTVQFDGDISRDALSSQLPHIQIVDMWKAEVNRHTYYTQRRKF